MSATHPARSLLTRRLVLRSKTPIPSVPEAVRQQQLPAPASRCRNFHTTLVHLKRRKRFSSVKAEELGLVSPKTVKDFTNRHFPQYTKEDKEVLSTHYTPEQMAAIEAGEKAISPEDLALQGRLRVGTYAIPYMDDFATIRPSIDKRAPDPGAEDPDPFARFLTVPEFHEDFFRWLEGFKPKDGEVDFAKLSDQEAKAALEKYIPTEEDLADFMLNRSAMTDRNRYKRTESAFASALPDKVPGVAGLYPKTKEGNDEIMDAVVAKSGWDEGLLKHAKLKIVETKTVHNQTRLGKVRSMRITIAAGNGDGWIGVATTKGLDMEEVIKKARIRAYLSMRPIRRYENRTIYGNVTGKVGGTVVEMFTRPPGFGNRAPSLVHELLRLAGIKDISTRMPRGRNKMNLARAVIEALHNQKDPEVIAQGLGRKLVDVRKVYYGGLVY